MACSQLVRCCQCYYDVAFAVFVDNVAALGVESCVLSDIHDLLSTKLIAGMDDKTVDLLTRESPEVTSTRHYAEEKQKVFSDGLKTCKQHVRRGRRPNRGEISQDGGAHASVAGSESKGHVSEQNISTDVHPALADPPLISETDAEIDDITSHASNLSQTPPDIRPEGESRPRSHSRAGSSASLKPGKSPRRRVSDDKMVRLRQEMATPRGERPDVSTATPSPVPSSGLSPFSVRSNRSASTYGTSPTTPTRRQEPPKPETADSGSESEL